MTNRIHIDSRSGIIDLEGDKDFVDAQLTRLLPLVEAAGFGKGPIADPKSEANDTSKQDEPATEKARNSKRSRRTSGATPKGHSCADRMLVLRNEGFFKEPKAPKEIVDGLAGKGWTHMSNQVSAAGSNMFNRGDIQRKKEGSGWVYFWDRE